MITGAWAVEAAIKCMTFTLLQELQREWLDQSVGKICSKGVRLIRLHLQTIHVSCKHM